MKPAYEMSASEDEAEEKPATRANVPQSSDSQSLQDSDIFKNILSEDNLERYDVDRLKRDDNTLFIDDIDEDDEIWHLQCPKEVDINSLQTVDWNVDSPVSKIKCKVEGKKKKYSVYSFQKASRVNFVLPNRETQSFEIKQLPVAGRLILQENVSTKHGNIKTEIKTE